MRARGRFPRSRPKSASHAVTRRWVAGLQRIQARAAARSRASAATKRSSAKGSPGTCPDDPPRPWTGSTVTHSSCQASSCAQVPVPRSLLSAGNRVLQLPNHRTAEARGLGLTGLNPSGSLGCLNYVARPSVDAAAALIANTARPPDFLSQFPEFWFHWRIEIFPCDVSESAHSAGIGTSARSAGADREWRTEAKYDRNAGSIPQRDLIRCARSTRNGSCQRPDFPATLVSAPSPARRRGGLRPPWRRIFNAELLAEGGVGYHPVARQS